MAAFLAAVALPLVGAVAWVLWRRGAPGAPVVLAMLLLAVLGTGMEPADGPRITYEVGGATGMYPRSCAPPLRFNGGGGAVRYTAPIGRDFEAGGEVLGSVAHAYRPRWASSVGESHLLFHVGALGTVDHRFFSFSLGAATTRDDEHLYSLPIGRLRLGPRDLIWLEADLGSRPPVMQPLGAIHLGLGVAVTRGERPFRDAYVLAGVSDAGVFVTPSFPLTDNLDLQPFAAYAEREHWALALRLRLYQPLGRR